MKPIVEKTNFYSDLRNDTPDVVTLKINTKLVGLDLNAEATYQKYSELVKSGGNGKERTQDAD